MMEDNQSCHMVRMRLEMCAAVCIGEGLIQTTAIKSLLQWGELMTNTNWVTDWMTMF